MRIVTFSGVGWSAWMAREIRLRKISGSTGVGRRYRSPGRPLVYSSFTVAALTCLLLHLPQGNDVAQVLRGVGACAPAE